jgi:hypothetical protein
MEFILNIEMENAAFDDDELSLEVGDLLRSVANRWESGAPAGNIMDSNGNYVGKFDLID